jgi:hypothetical protein
VTDNLFIQATFNALPELDKIPAEVKIDLRIVQTFADCDEPWSASPV